MLLDYLPPIEEPRELHRVARPLAELLLLTVCGTIADCDDYDAIVGRGEQHLAFLRQFLPYHHGVPTGRWLTIMMSRISPALVASAFTG
ncbi:ISAs1 family transposase [Microvirga massiliensis]|uniref:ISAs1 family transposase n=1 Tax=Microvirga massiliensis TaxID=1033741 RepID=UPI00062BA60F